MITVGTAELKNNLSSYLKKVRQGGRIIITDRGVPVAQITPVDASAAASFSESLAHMVAEDLVAYDFSAKPFEPVAKVDLKADIASRYVIQDREE